jgi:hypothetical protein
VYHLLSADLGGLLLLLAGERRAGHDSRADGGGRAESGPGEGAEEAGGVHRGRSAGAGLTHWGSVCGPGRCAVMELRVEVDGGGEPKALAELHAAAERPAPHVTLAQNIPSPPKTGFPTHQHCPMLLHYAFYFWIVLL